MIKNLLKFFISLLLCSSIFASSSWSVELFNIVTPDMTEKQVPYYNSFNSLVVPKAIQKSEEKFFAQNLFPSEPKVQKIKVPSGFMLLSYGNQQKYYEKIRPDVDQVKFIDDKGNIIQSVKGLNDKNFKFLSLFQNDKKQNQNDCISSNPLGKIDGLQTSCNLVEDSIVDLPDGEDSPLHILSLLKISESSFSKIGKRRSPEFCQNCYNEAFKAIGDNENSETLEQVEKRLYKKARIQKLQQKTAELMNAHIFLKSYYKNHKESIERAISKASKSDIFSGLPKSIKKGAIADQIRQNNLCLKFSDLGYEVESNAIDDNFSFEVESIPVKNSCLKNSKLFFEGISKDLEKRYPDFSMGLSIAENEIFGSELGSYIDEKINSHSDLHIKNYFDTFDEKKLQERMIISARLLGAIESEFKSNLNDLKQTCKINDEGEKRKILLKTFFKSFSPEGSSEEIILENAAKWVRILSLSNSNFMPFVISSRPICNLIAKTKKAEDINIHDLHDFINLNNPSEDPEIQDRIDREHYERLKNASHELCGDFETYDMQELICNEDKSLNLYSELSNLKAKTAKEKIVKNKLLCKSEAKLSDEGINQIKAGKFQAASAGYYLAQTGQVNQDGTQKNSDQAIQEIAKSMLEKKTESTNSKRGGRAPASNSSENTDDIISRVLSSNSVGKESANALLSGRNSVLTGEQINGLSGDLSGEIETSIDSSLDNNSSPGNQNSGAGSSSPSSEIASMEEMEPSDKRENSFQDNLNNLLNQSNGLFQQAQTSSFNPNQTVQDLLNSQVSASEVMEAVTDNGKIADDFEKAKQGLSDQLITGENAGEALTEAISGKKEISAEDLGCKNPDKTKCDLENAELLKQIEELKAQVKANTQLQRSKEIDEKSAKRIADLEAEVEKFKKIAEAKVSSGIGSTSLGSSQNKGNSSSGNTQLLDTGKILNSSSSNRNPAGTQVSTSPVDKAPVKIVPSRVLKNTQDYIDKKDFNIELDQSKGLVLTINKEGIDKYPVEISGVIMGDNGINGIVVQGGAQVSLASLPEKSREAVVQFLEEKQESLVKVVKEKKQERKVIKDIQSVAKTRYIDMLCAVNPDGQDCRK